jgi:2-hydroxycyclohexanecarboxyl-CoA dehydrogenase
MTQLLDLSGRVALVTGAGQGVGRQIALHFAAHGADAVIVNDIYPERAEAVAAEVNGAGGRALAAPCDVTDLDGVTEMLAPTIRQTGRVDILVNNAGNAGPGSPLETAPFWETGPDDWARWLGPNLYGVLNCTRSVLGGMVERRYGRIITIVSDAGRVGEPNLVVYSAAKAGAAGLTRAIAKLVGRYGVTANNVALSATRTPAMRELGIDDEAAERLLQGYSIRRLGEPEDAAGLVLFLASHAASWITGQTYPVNGGYAVAL